MENKDYEKLYRNFMNYEEEVHKKNQKRISVGLKVNILFPLIFLILCFITDASKLIFLILWILSLFGIAFYLMYVEFEDYKLQEKMKEFRGENADRTEDEEPKALIGSAVVDVESTVSQKMDHLDERADERKEAIREHIQEKKDALHEKRESFSQRFRSEMQDIARESNAADTSENAEDAPGKTKKSEKTAQTETKGEEN